MLAANAGAGSSRSFRCVSMTAWSGWNGIGSAAMGSPVTATSKRTLATNHIPARSCPALEETDDRLGIGRFDAEVKSAVLTVAKRFARMAHLMADTFDWSVTFEYEARPPDTLRGTSSGGTGRGTAARAVREAQKALKPRGWSSFVVLVAKAGVLNAKD
jgi:hypothetical protein